MEAFAAASTVIEVTYFRRLLKLLLALGARGQCVIVGRGAMIVLPVDTTLRVRVVASHEDRVALIGRERGLNPTEAARYVESTDRERSRFIRQHFHKDLTDPLLYDLVLNASRLSVEECAGIVIETLLRLQARTAPVKQGQRRLEDRGSRDDSNGTRLFRTSHEKQASGLQPGTRGCFCTPVYRLPLELYHHEERR